MTIIALVSSVNATLLPLDLEQKVIVISLHPCIYPDYYASRVHMVDRARTILSFQCINLCKEDLKDDMYSQPHKIEDIFNNKTYIYDMDICSWEYVEGPRIVFCQPIKISFTKENLEKLLSMAKDIVSVAPEDRCTFLAQWLLLNFGFDSGIDAPWQRELFISGTEYRNRGSFI